MELGFADGVSKRSGDTEDVETPSLHAVFQGQCGQFLMDKIAAKCAIEPKPTLNTEPMTFGSAQSYQKLEVIYYDYQRTARKRNQAWEAAKAL